MEIRQIRYFVVLAETLHFGKAATLLHISQPPLSRQIALLEEDLGVVLLDRTSRKVRLAPAGLRFYEDARLILATMDKARSHARAADLGEEGTLMAGFMFAAAHSIVPILTRGYISAYPRVELKLSESIPTQLVADIRAGTADIGIMYPSDSVAELVTRTIFREQLVAILPEGHRLCSRTAISIGELREESFIISPYAASPCIYNTIVGHCRRSGFTPRIRMETKFQQTIVSLVGQRLGVALVHNSMRSTHADNVKFMPLMNAPYVDVAMVWNPHTLNPCVERFVDIAAQMGLDAHA